jgi:SAM-dependent methyltransferase
MLAGLPAMPALLVATEGWTPNLRLAARRLRPLGGSVLAVKDDQAALPFRDDAADLVTSRHPIVTWWDEIARVLRPGGSYLSQQVGPHSLAELTEILIGPQTASSPRDPALAHFAATSAGLDVVALRSERLRTVFYDIGAVIYFLRLVVWIFPGFTVEAHQDRLLELHHRMENDGCFVAHATRFLIDARKPG